MKVKCKVEEKSSFKRSLKRLNQKTKKRVKEAIEILKEKPFSGKTLKGKYKRLWKYRIGRYRIIYLPKSCYIQLILISLRDSVY
ncbi:MAG: type II toxin-antitoxin system RelE/ParE family toxin [archaeon GB-1867-035]|nr:type II toxin-antitoxin system RelE/ParE family toxin [Candidatus Culexmicrobium profundum]